MKAKRLGGSEFYKKAGFKALIVHVSPDTHKKLSAIAQLDRRSLHFVAQAILERAASEPEKAMQSVRGHIKALAGDKAV